MNALIGALCLAILSGINYRLGGSFVYPPALFAGWWSLLLVTLACSGNTFLPLSSFTLVIYIIGPCAMSLGGLLALVSHRRNSSASSPGGSWECRGRMLTGSLVLLTAMLPVLWHRIQQISAASGVRNFWVGVRYQSLQADTSLGIFEELIFFSTITAWVAFLEQQRLGTGKLRAVIAILLGAVYHLVTASRLGVLTMIAGLIGIAMIHGKNLFRTVLTGALGIIVVFVVVALALNKGAEHRDSPTTQAISLAQSFQLYALGGVVAFDTVVQGLVAPESQGRTYRLLYVSARALGYKVEPPPMIAQYTYTPIPTNVYSMYCPYFVDFGATGVAVILAIIGFLATVIYLGARQGAWPLMVAYGLIFSYIVLSSADEYLFTLIAMNVRAGLFIGLLYKYSRAPRLRCVPALTSSP
jgi:oligosaccharide repeat unit polymerase